MSMHESTQTLLQNLTINRSSYSKFSKEEVDTTTIQKILDSANGITPSLGNNFHYRVDQLPQDVKDAMYPYMHSAYANCTQETQDAFEKDWLAKSIDEWYKEGICFNHQFAAPVVLAYSIPVRIDGSFKPWQHHEFKTGKDAIFIAIGMNMWNTICTVEEMGLNSCCLKAYNPKALEQINVETSEELPEGWKYEPFLFLCIGKGITVKGDHREHKPNGIVNSLNFAVKQ